MSMRTLLVSLIFTSVCFGQGLPDRDELIAKFLDEKTADQATRDLCKHFGMGGLRTIIRNVNKLPLERRLQYANVFMYMDIQRFSNDINANVAKAEDAETRAMWLRLLARQGRFLDPTVFEKWVRDESQDMRVRIAAMSGLVQKQDPARYKRLYELADTAVVDPITGRNDLEYAFLTKENKALYYFTKSELDKKPGPGTILIALALADAGDWEVFEKIIKMRKKKQFPMLINRAVQIGGVDILDQMAANKAFKKLRNQIKSGKTAASALAAHNSKLYAVQTHDKKTNPLGAVLPLKAGGTGRDGYSAGYAIVKVAADGTVSLVEAKRPFGGNDQLSALEGKTIPAFSNWEPVESYHLIFSP